MLPEQVAVEVEVGEEIGLFYMRNNISMIIFEGTASYTTFAP